MKKSTMKGTCNTNENKMKNKHENNTHEKQDKQWTQIKQMNNTQNQTKKKQLKTWNARNMENPATINNKTKHEITY